MNQSQQSDEKMEIPEYLREERVRNMLALAIRCAQVNGAMEVTAEVGHAEAMAIAAFFLAHEHHGGILELLQAGRLGSALAMLRPCFEAMLTGLWLLRGASEEQIALYGQGRISNRVEDMLRGLRKGANPEEDAFLQTTWELSKTSLHQYTHCSFQLLARCSNGTLTDVDVSPDEVVNVMRFATGTAMLSTIELARIGTHKKLENLSLAILWQLYPNIPDEEPQFVEGLTDEEHRANHRQAHLIAAKLTVMALNLMRENQSYFEEHTERFEEWQKFMNESGDLADKKNFFDVCVHFDKFLIKAFVLDAPILRREVIQEFSDVRAGKE